MANDLVKVPPKLDGFDGFENGTEGEEQRGSLTRGQTIKFTNNYTWITRDGEELSPHLELVVVDHLRIVQRRHVDGPAENRILEPLQKFPDIEKMNEETLRSEWVEGPDGQLRGPYQRL